MEIDCFVQKLKQSPVLFPQLFFFKLLEILLSQERLYFSYNPRQNAAEEWVFRLEDINENVSGYHGYGNHVIKLLKIQESVIYKIASYIQTAYLFVCLFVLNDCPKGTQ